MSLGSSKTEVMDSCPKELEYWIKAYEMQRRRQDEADWILGMYVQSAVSVAIEHNFAGRKATSKYVEKPLMRDANVEAKLSDEELTKQRELFMAKLNLMKSNFEIEKKRKELNKNAEHG